MKLNAQDLKRLEPPESGQLDIPDDDVPGLPRVLKASLVWCARYLNSAGK